MVLEIPSAFGEQLASGKPAVLRLYADSSRTGDERYSRRVASILSRYSQQIAGQRLLHRILAQPAMQPFIAAEHLPGPSIRSDDELLAYCRETGSTIYHPSCSARMGTDPLAVVDGALKIRGLDGIRVVDASVMPAVVSGNTNAACVMIGEKASDMILEDARAKPAAKAA